MALPSLTSLTFSSSFHFHQTERWARWKSKIILMQGICKLKSFLSSSLLLINNNIWEWFGIFLDCLMLFYILMLYIQYNDNVLLYIINIIHNIYYVQYIADDHVFAIFWKAIWLYMNNTQNLKYVNNVIQYYNTYTIVLSTLHADTI
jgi:hypothetical protein